MKKRVIVIAIVLVACLIAWLVYAHLVGRSKGVYAGTVETREIQIGSKVGGRVIEVPVEEGQVVKAGSLLVRFECDELKAERAQAAAAADTGAGRSATAGARQSSRRDRAGRGQRQGAGGRA